jgi:hypothetical protein
VRDPEPRPSWRVPVAIAGAIALLAVAGVAFALEQVESDAEREATEPAPVVERAAPAAGRNRPADVATWPAGTSAWTVILATMRDEATAHARAVAAIGGGVPAGILDTDDHPSLEPGDWALFAGRYDSRAEAAEEAVRYAAAGYPEAAPAFVGDAPAP